MLLALLASLSLGTTLDDLKLQVKPFEWYVGSTLARGLEDPVISRWNLPNHTLPALTPQEKADLTRAALTQLKAFVMSPEGREQWLKALQGSPRDVAERSAGLASSVAYWSTLARERKPPVPRDAQLRDKFVNQQRAFAADRPRLEREVATFLQAQAQHDETMFIAQLKERLAYFLSESKNLPFDAKLVEVDGRKLFADGKLEGKPNWWKFCFRAGPEATNAAREFAAQWLAELNAPSAKLSDDK